MLRHIRLSTFSLLGTGGRTLVLVETSEKGIVAFPENLKGLIAIVFKGEYGD
jgi:hypothetical protein